MQTNNYSANKISELQPSITTLAGKSPWFYGFGVLGFNLFIETFNGFAYYYYIEVLGLAMTMAAMVRLIFTIWDAINDPIFGYLSDNTRFSWGRRRTWLLPSSLLIGFTFVLIFSVPSYAFEKTRLFWYMLIILLVYETLITILTINYLALFPEYFPRGEERSRASVYFQAAKNLAVMLGLTLSPLIYNAIGFSMMAVVYSIVGVGLLLISILKNREDPIVQTRKKIAFLPAFKNVLNEHHFWLYGLTFALAAFGVNMIPFALPFYVLYVLRGDAGSISLLSGVALISSLIILPAWGKITRKWRMKNIFPITLLIMSCGVILLCLSHNIVISIIGVTLFGIGWGGISVCNHIIRADLISHNLSDTGKNTEALYYSLLNVIQRLAGLLQSLAMFLAAAWFGYVSGSNPGPHPDMAFRILIGLVPLIGFLIAWIISRYFFKHYLSTLSV